MVRGNKGAQKLSGLRCPNREREQGTGRAANQLGRRMVPKQLGGQACPMLGGAQLEEGTRVPKQ